MYFGYLLDIVLLIFALIFCFRKSKPKFIKVFAVFSFANILSDINSAIGIHFANGGNEGVVQIVRVIYSLLMLFELIFFTYLLSQLIQSVIAKKTTGLLYILFILSFTLFL